MYYLPEWLVACHFGALFVNYLGSGEGGVDFLAPKNTRSLRLIRGLWVVAVFVTALVIMLGTIMFMVNNAPLWLCFQNGWTYLVACSVFLVSVALNYVLLFTKKRLFIADEEERLRQSRIEKHQQQHRPIDLDLDERNGVDLFDCSLDYLRQFYGFTEEEIARVRNETCDCVPCLPIDALVEHIRKLSITEKGAHDVGLQQRHTATQFIDDFLGQIEEAHRQFEEHQQRCEKLSFSDQHQQRLAQAMEEKKKGL